MPNIKPFTKHFFYNQELQRNRLQWTILYKDGEDSFQKISGNFQCKDFFNDLVALKRGRKFSVYGFNNETITFNEEGLYVLLDNIMDMESFSRNTGIFAAKAQEQLGVAPHFTEVDQHTAIVLIPHKFFDLTYPISLLTWLIRISNYRVTFDSWGDIFKKAQTVGDLSHEIRDWYVAPVALHLPVWGFVPPPEVQACWFFADYNCNSTTQPGVSPSVIHNNGFVNTITACYNSGVLKASEQQIKEVA